MGNPWQSKLWQEFRAEHLKNQCEICGASGPDIGLSIHHKQKLWPYQIQWNGTARHIYEQTTGKSMLEQKKEPYKIVNRCPGCGTGSIGRPRKKKSPKYRCGRCKTEFEEPIKDPQYKIRWTQDYRDFIERERDKITEVVDEARDQQYHDSTQVMTVCKSCHWRLEQGLRLCKECKKNWHKGKFKTCYDCIPPEKKKEIQERRDFMEAMAEEDRRIMEEIDREHARYRDENSP